VYDILAHHHWRAVAIDQRVPHPNYNLFTATISIEYENEQIGITIREITPSGGENEKLLFIVEVLPKRRSLGYQIGDRIISGKCLL